jgi:hypothetical protein
MEFQRSATAGPTSAVGVALLDRVQEELSDARLLRFSTAIGPAIAPSSFWVPEYLCPSAWIEHAPFAFWISAALQPRRFVELGTHHGYSYFAFCQAIERLGLGTTAYAVDTWQGDEHAGFYSEAVLRSVAARNRQKYAAFSTLLQTTFDDALRYFADCSVDLIHIDGRHFYDDVRHDFTMWRPKLTKDAVVLFHDTNVREREFGVWRFFEEVAAQHPSFRFFHGHGLGVLTLGDSPPDPLSHLFRASPEAANQIRAAYASLGGSLAARRTLAAKSDGISFLLNKPPGAADGDAGKVAEITDGDEQAQQLRSALETRDCALQELRAQLEHYAATEAALRTEVQQRYADVAVLRAEIEQRSATEAVLRAEIEQRAATETVLRAEIEQRAAMEDALRQQIAIGGDTEAALRTALDEAKRQIEALSASIETGKAEIAAMRSELAKRDRQLQDAGNAAAGLRSDNALLLDKITEAEQRLRDGETANNTLQSEVQSLNGQLAVAREVGGAVMAALRTEIVGAPQPLRDRGFLGQIWRTLRSREVEGNIVTEVV